MPLQHLSPACWRLCLLSTYTHFFSSFLFFSFKLSYLSHVIFFGYFPVILNCYEVHKGRPTTVDSHEQKMRPSSTIILKFNVILKVYVVLHLLYTPDDSRIVTVSIDQFIKLNFMETRFLCLLLCLASLLRPGAFLFWLKIALDVCIMLIRSV